MQVVIEMTGLVHRKFLKPIMLHSLYNQKLSLLFAKSASLGKVASSVLVVLVVLFVRLGSPMSNILGWIFTCVFLFAIPNAYTTETPIEEIVASANNRCGPWAIAHEVSHFCEYPVLREAHLSVVLALREKLVSTCLSCGEVCQTKTLVLEDRITCEMLFSTPTRLFSLSSLGARDRREFSVRFSYDISIEGRVVNIQLLNIVGEIPASELQRLLEQGARQVRFKPPEIDGIPRTLTGLVDAYVMEMSHNQADH